MFFINKKKMILFFIIFFVVLDRFCKALAVNYHFNQPLHILQNIFSLYFTPNYNIAFSLPLGGLFLNIMIILIILGLIYYLLFLISKKEFAGAVFLLAIILGAASNLLDRLKYGFVIDYLDLKYFTVFNLADVMIVGGVMGIGCLMLKDKKIA